MKRDLIPTLLLSLAAAMPCAQAQTVVYVDADAIGANDGSSWADARIDLQVALGSAVPGDEIWVANGMYKPTAGVNRGVSVSLANGVSLFGGFEGGDSINFPGGETQRDQRNTDPATNGTVLSGDIGSPGDNSDNSFHVVTGGATDATAILDGFTIKAGNANGSSFPDNSGGGVFNLAGSPMLKNCLIKENAAFQRGGGMFTGVSELGAVSNPQLINCRFDNNSATGIGLPGATGGGGLFNGNLENFADTSKVYLTDCTFSGNSALGGPGGGMIDFAATSELTNCNFIGNSAPFWGGGLSNGKGFFNSVQTLIGCTFIGNVSDNRGGGMYSAISATAALTNCTFIGNISNNAGGGGLYNRHSSVVTLSNCTFIDNQASTSSGGAIKSVGDTQITLINCTVVGNKSASGIAGGGLRLSSNAIGTVANCIFWQNSDMDGLMDEAAQIDNAGPGPVTVDHSLIQGLTGTFGGVGNIDADPLFVDLDGTDNIPGTEDDNLLLSSVSPCIDAADNTSVLMDIDDLDGDTDFVEPIPIDIDGNPRFVDYSLTADTGVGPAPIVDMGAREFNGSVVTEEGTDVVVQPVDPATGDAPVTMTFDDVTESGVTSLVTSSMGQPPPSGFKLGMPATYYELSTTAQFEGAVEICIDYSGINYGNEMMLTLEHLEGGVWVDVTTSLDTVNKIICGSATSLSSFAIFEPEEPAGMIEALITQIDALEIPDGIKNSLTRVLEAAIIVLSDFPPDNDGAAVNLLDAFVHHVEAHSGNNITEEDASALIEAAVAIQEILTSG